MQNGARAHNETDRKGQAIFERLLTCVGMGTNLLVDEDFLAYTAAIHAGLIACPHCDLLLQQIAIPAQYAIVCPRCGYTLGKHHAGSLDKTLALTITGLFLYLPAILLPLLTLEKLGMSEAGNVLETILGLYHNDYIFVAAMVMLSAVLFPAILLLLLFTVSLQLKIGKTNRLSIPFFRLALRLEEWAMVEVYLIGILVTIFKMNDTAAIVYDSGFFFLSPWGSALSVITIYFGACLPQMIILIKTKSLIHR